MKIKNKKILEHIEKMFKASDKLIAMVEKRRAMNDTFTALMDEEYGKDGWLDVDFSNGTFISAEEEKAQLKPVTFHNKRKKEEPKKEDIGEIGDIELIESEAVNG